MPIVQNSATLRADLVRLIATGGPLADCSVGLYQNDVTPTVGSSLTDFDAATFDGYNGAVTFTWGTPYTVPDGSAEVTSLQMLQDQMTGSATPNILYGYYMFSDSVTLRGAERFEEPVPMSAVGDAVLFSVSARQPAT